jgi:hypothetical protein
MNIAEERLRAAAREAARVFPAGGDLPPLRLPEIAGGQQGTRVRAAVSGIGRNRRWLSPLAAAAAVAAVAVAAVLVAPGLQPGPHGMLGGGNGGVKLTPAQIAVLTGGTKRTWVVYALADNATQKATERCMNAHGLVYHPFYERTAEAATMATLVLGVPGAAFSLAARKTRGYGFYAHAVRHAKHTNSGDRSGRQDKHAASLPPNRQRYASAGKECTAAARRLVYGSQADFRLIANGWTEVQAQLNRAVQADPAFPAVIAKWAACMTAHGYDYSGPDNLWNRLSVRVYDKPTAANRALEIRTAVQDYHCAQTVKLVTTIKALQTRHARYVSKAIARNVARIIDVFAQALKEARRLHVTGQSGH